MAFENTQNTKTYSKINLGTANYNFQTKLPAEEIANILSISVLPCIKTYEAVSGSISVCGVCKVEVLYQNNEGAVKSSMQMVDFATDLNGYNGQHLFFNIREKQTSASILGGGEIVVNSVFEIDIEDVTCTEITAPSTGNDGVFEQVKTLNIQSLAAVSEDKIIVVEESEISATGILSCDATCLATKVTPATDSLTIDGELLVSICSEIEGNLKTTFKRIEFSSEVSALGASSDNIADYTINVENCTATLSNDGTNALLTISATLKVVANLYQTNSINVIDDVFSTEKELIVSTTGIDTQKFVEKTYKEHDLTVTLSTKDKNVNMGSILAVLSPIYSDSQIDCTVIYRHAETDKIESVVLSSPVAEYASPSVIIKSFAKKKAKEVEVELAVITSNATIENKYDTYVSSIEEGNEIETDNKAIVVYQAVAGESLFSAAKALKVAPEVLKSQNAELEDIIPENRKIVFYKRAIAKL